MGLKNIKSEIIKIEPIVSNILKKKQDFICIKIIISARDAVKKDALSPVKKIKINAKKNTDRLKYDNFDLSLKYKIKPIKSGSNLDK